MVTAYPVANKKKSFDICLAFVRGCGGQIGTTYRDTPAFFYGVDGSNVEVFRQAIASGRDWYYCDNSYFDSNRQQHFRVTKNRLQHSGLGISDGKRFAALGIQILPWRTGGEHIVVCPQSDSFMATVAAYPGNWAQETMERIAAASMRPVMFRGWSADKKKIASTLTHDLERAHVLMTWSSAAAVTAVLAGVPVIVDAADCAAKCMSSAGIEDLATPEREVWAGVLADNEWSLDEFRSGKAWSHLQA